jgi:hypothetical protein
MTWTIDEKVERLLRLPWTVTSEPADDLGEFVVRIAELPGMIVVGTPAEINVEFWDALRATLRCYVEVDDRVPLPREVELYPWERRQSIRPEDLGIIRLTGRGRWEVTARTSVSALPGGAQPVEA